ncbi:TonB-dependent receptor [Oleiagrimonas sp. C23AA]|uniref:TonB-dependent receptor n=1 Tax=Oleiagrimonas sp. C23AA TaxID=2719047 RepID=UPI001422568B|nr:TonB-dependent receptor [Oleiagrimonas sp. C23AA]NII09435.1 TonB-dependent receptor [Oleiagrimonas sp. C23AA]
MFHSRLGARLLKKRLLATVITASVTAAIAMPTVSFAQTNLATVRGTAPANTTITAFNTATGSTRKTTSSANGSFTLVGLQPGTYSVQAGNGPAQTVTLSVASTSRLNLKGGNGAATATASPANAQSLQSVTVSASSLPEVKTSQVGDTVSLRQIQELPQISRNFLEFADVVPGVQFKVDANGNTSLQAGAQNSNGTNVFIDGVSQKSYVMGGGMAGQSDSQGNPFPQLAIGQYKVITSNYKAEYGQISSAAVTAQTKSGTNEFHGEVFDRYTSDKYRARTPAENADGSKSVSQEKEFGASLGGPIIKDAMHFFVTYEGKRFNQPIAVTPIADYAYLQDQLPANVQSQFGPASLPFQENLYFGKIDWEPTDRDRFELSGKIRKETAVSGIGNQTAASAAINKINDDKRFNLKWDHSAEAWFNELIIGHQDTVYNPSPRSYGNGYIYTSGVQNPKTIITTGPASPLAAQDKSQKGWLLKDDFTFNDIQWHGDHVVKMGVTYRKLDLMAADAANVNPQFTYNVTDNGTEATPYKVLFTQPVTGLGLTPTVKTKDQQFGAYIQDDWDITDRLTFNLGVRWDYEKNPSYTNFVTPQNVVDALYSQDPNAPAGQTYADSLAKGGVNVADYISNGHNRSNYKGEWQPRFGFSYDLFDDERHVIHGGAGRSYDRNLYNYLQLETTKSALPQYTYYFQNPQTGECLGGRTPCVAWNPDYLNGLSSVQQLQGSASNAGTEVDLLNNNMKAPYSDQFSIGMSNQIGEWLTDVTFVHITYKNGFAFTLGNRYPNGDFFENHSQPWGNGVPGFGSLIIGNNGIESRNNELLLSANKPYTKESGWGATFAYTLIDADQNRDVNEHYSFDYATVGDYPFIASNAAPKNRFVASGTFDGPWGITLGAKLTLQTPTPMNSSACFNGDGGAPVYTFPNGSYCEAYAATPHGNGKFLVGGKVWGYRDVDLQATKNFDLGHGITLYGRLNLINVFNFNNYVDTISDITAGPGNETVVYNKNGNITYAPRTVKFELGMRF